ncbi:protein associated with RNAse G/E [Mycoplasmoides fastidiosum]|uniref:Protein associated with RNAse G/E n=1 Tax=Mycoplasmoides fastidiosum TaxID=92758 RepID=A0ABU0LYH9_9BACT|nr:DUF402 domain-containing protein [Mycoplasmoides fastidiosum]MDQ0513675.1 protein associated with RNAse G/E [Mycoplasmoides fastidiosum]UUD37906.1 DUF402 domain-containing protein [Mycoplasmoides fastidiosum]
MKFKQIKYMVHAYKYNGWLYRIVEYPYLLYETPTILCLYLPPKSVYSIKSEEDSARSFCYNNSVPRFWFFFKKKWFNIVVHVFEDRHSFYVNIASPYIIEEGAIKYVDLDLDFRIQSNDHCKVLDQTELVANIKKWKYPKRLINKIDEARREILYLIQTKWFHKLFNLHQLKFANKLILEKFADVPELRSVIQKLKPKPPTKKHFHKKFKPKNK